MSHGEQWQKGSGSSCGWNKGRIPPAYAGHGSWLLPRGQSSAWPRDEALVVPLSTHPTPHRRLLQQLQCFLGNELQLVFPNRLIMTQSESNDAILKGIIRSQLGGSASLQLQPMRLRLWRCREQLCVPHASSGCTFFLGIPHPSTPLQLCQRLPPSHQVWDRGTMCFQLGESTVTVLPPR